MPAATTQTLREGSLVGGPGDISTARRTPSGRCCAVFVDVLPSTDGRTCVGSDDHVDDSLTPAARATRGSSVISGRSSCSARATYKASQKLTLARSAHADPGARHARRAATGDRQGHRARLVQHWRRYHRPEPRGARRGRPRRRQGAGPERTSVAQDATSRACSACSPPPEIFDHTTHLRLPSIL